MMKDTDRKKFVNSVKNKLTDAVLEVTKDLTDVEFLRVFNKVYDQ